MNQFLNYDVNYGLSINTYRKAGASWGDVGDVVIALKSGNRNVCCDLEGAADSLCDYLNGTSTSRDAAQEVYNYIQANSGDF